LLLFLEDFSMNLSQLKDLLSESGILSPWIVTCVIFLNSLKLNELFQPLSHFKPTDPVIMSHFSKLPRKIRDKGALRSWNGKKRDKVKRNGDKNTYTKNLETQ
jgi:hypothetical protein